MREQNLLLMSPHMAVVVDHGWDVVRANSVATRFMSMLFPAPPDWATSASTRHRAHPVPGPEKIALFTTIAIIGDAHDLTLAELRLETFWPVDEASRSSWQRLFDRS